MRLDYQSYQEVADYLQHKDIAIIPIGSTEQHSPDGLLGTDYLVAEDIAREVGQRLGIMVTPTIAIGIAIHHMGFAGTITLQPSTMIAYINDYVESLIQHGFAQFFFINGHGGNVPTLQAALAEIMNNHRIKSEIISWWHLPELQEKEKEFFGEQNGRHATVSEISITRAQHEEAFLDEHGFPKKLMQQEYDTEMTEFAWPLSSEGFSEIFPFGNMGSNPTLASVEKGRILFKLAVDTVCQLVAPFENKKY